jgi:hypothetical protein
MIDNLFMCAFVLLLATIMMSGGGDGPRRYS